MIKKTLIILLTLFLTSCYDHQELNEIAILTASEINKIDNEFIINAEIVNPQSKDNQSITSSPFIIYQGKGKTIQEAYRMIKLSSSRYIYPDHLRIVIINENLAKEDITEILDFFLRNPLARSEFNILIGKTENILNPISPIDNISSNSIINTLKTSNNYLGITNDVTLNTLASMKLNPHTEIIIPSIELINKEEENNTLENIQKTTIDSIYQLSTLAIFKDNKLKGYLTKDESITYNLIKNKIKNTIITYECEKNKYLSLEIINNKTKIKIKNNKININLSITATINESSCNIKLNNEQSIYNLEKDLNNYLKNNLIQNINNIRNKYNSDVFGFLDFIYKYDYNTYQKVKNTWYQETFQTIDININPQIKIIAKGNVMEGINEKN